MSNETNWGTQPPQTNNVAKPMSLKPVSLKLRVDLSMLVKKKLITRIEMSYNQSGQVVATVQMNNGEVVVSGVGLNVSQAIENLNTKVVEERFEL